MGPGCGGPAPELAITPPVRGAPLVISLTSAFPDAHTFLYFGPPPAAPLQINPQCLLYLDPFSATLFAEFFTDAQGNYSMVIPLPADAPLLGMDFAFQARVWAAGGPFGGDHATGGIEVSVGCEPAGNGCTPGYWKQPQHFADWPAPYAPSMPFSAVFADAFPGLTLLDVLELGGGGLEALGRHAVAALLSASSPSVGYGLDPTQVITLFDGVFSGPPDGYEPLKDDFEMLNEQGCPLN